MKHKHFGHTGSCCGNQRPPRIVVAYITVRYILPQLIYMRLVGLCSWLYCVGLNTVAWVRIKLRNQAKSGSCWDCSNHRIVPDRHPIDRWRSRDKAMLCKLMMPTPPVLPNRVKPPKMRFNRRIVSCACSSLDELRNSKVPEWCPIREK